MATFTLKRVQQVSLTRPHGSGAAARHFYGDGIELAEIHTADRA